VNRLTITLPDDLYAMARAHAVSTRTSISKAIGDLLRRRNGPPPPAVPLGSSQSVHPETGFPLIELAEGTTMEDMERAMEDEGVRHLETMGLSPEEIERALAR
jgi:hypothetical protein